MNFPNKNEQIIKHGVEPTELDKRDFSLNKTFGLKFGAIAPQLPATLDLDANLYPVPNQNTANDFFGIPPLPYGCTEYTANDICTDEDNVPYNPMYTEGKVHANARGGIDMRTPLASVCDNGVLQKDMPLDIFADKRAALNKRDSYFRVGQNPDYFDGFRIAMFANNRPISIGTPWFGEWAAAGWGNNYTREADGSITVSAGGTPTGFMPMPNVKNLKGLSWHCYTICGWIVKDGVPYIKCKPWCGPFFGDKGFVYLSREVLNAVMTISGTSAFTLAKASPATIQTVGMTYIFKNNLNYGQNSPEVAELQKALQSLGYTIVHAVTTNYLGETRDALAKFQKDQQISDDGTHFGPLTRYALNRILNPSQSLFGSIQLFVQTFLGIL